VANQIARDLRKRMTRQEVKLWLHLRSWRDRGFRLRRQAPWGPYILDFLCTKHRLVFELDGGQHNLDAHARRDAIRDGALMRAGYRVLRFWNNDVDRNLEVVLTLIDDALRSPHPAARKSAQPPSPASGGGMEQATRQERFLDTLD
jgi:very-short-patch-repair endonuclease